MCIAAYLKFKPDCFSFFPILSCVSLQLRLFFSRKKTFYVDHKAVCDLLARQLQSQAQTSNRLFAARSDSIRGFYLFIQAIYLPRAYKKAAHLSVILIIGTARRSRKLAAWDNLIGVVQKSRRATTSQRVLIQLNKILSRHINLGFNGTVNFTVERDLN